MGWKRDLQRNPIQILIFERLGMDSGRFWGDFGGVLARIFRRFDIDFFMDLRQTPHMHKARLISLS